MAPKKDPKPDGDAAAQDDPQDDPQDGAGSGDESQGSAGTDRLSELDDETIAAMLKMSPAEQALGISADPDSDVDYLPFPDGAPLFLIPTRKVRVFVQPAADFIIGEAGAVTAHWPVMANMLDASEIEGANAVECLMPEAAVDEKFPHAELYDILDPGPPVPLVYIEDANDAPHEWLGYNHFQMARIFGHSHEAIRVSPAGLKKRVDRLRSAYKAHHAPVS